MAYRTKRYGRRRNRRKNNRTRRRTRMSNPLGKQLTNNYRKFRCRFTYFFPVSNIIAAGAQLLPYSFALNYVGYYRNQAGTYAQIAGGGTGTPSNYLRFFGGNGAFDQYKVLRLMVTWIPSEQDVRTSGVNYEPTDSPSLFYSFNDYDDSVNFTTEGQALNAGQVPKSYVAGVPIRRTMRQAPENRNKYLNAQNQSDPNVGTISASEVTISNPAAGMKTIIMCGPQALNPGFVGRFYACWDVIFRGLHATP